MSYDNIYQQKLDEVTYFYNINRYETALAKLDQLLADYPNESELLYLKALGLFYLDCNDEAEDCCIQALTNGSSACDCNFLLGRIYMETKKLVQAEQCFLEALRIDPQRADIIAAYAYLMLTAGNKNKAQKLLKEALKMDPEDESVLHYNFFYSLIINNKSDLVESFEQYMKSSQGEVNKLTKIGIIEESRGNYKAACESFKQAYLLDPTNEVILKLV